MLVQYWLWPCIHLSVFVKSGYCIKTTGHIELVFAMEVSLIFPILYCDEIWVSAKGIVRAAKLNVAVGDSVCISEVFLEQSCEVV